MSTTWTLDIQSKVGPALRQWYSSLEGADRASVNLAMGEAVQACIVDHLTKEAPQRHKTANRLGAEPSNFLGQAIKAASAADVVTTVANGALLTFRHPALARAFRDITIVPKKAKALTFPLTAEAYAHRAREFDDLFVYTSRFTGEAFLARPGAAAGDRPVLMYLLAKQAHQPQDRSLMPSDEQLTEAAVDGFKTEMTRLFQAGQI